MAVSRRLGHASASVAEDVYGHLLTGQQCPAARGARPLDRVIGPRMAPRWPHSSQLNERGRRKTLVNIGAPKGAKTPVSTLRGRSRTRTRRSGVRPRSRPATGTPMHVASPACTARSPSAASWMACACSARTPSNAGPHAAERGDGCDHWRREPLRPRLPVAFAGAGRPTAGDGLRALGRRGLAGLRGPGRGARLRLRDESHPRAGRRACAQPRGGRLPQHRGERVGSRGGQGRADSARRLRGVSCEGRNLPRSQPADADRGRPGGRPVAARGAGAHRRERRLPQRPDVRRRYRAVADAGDSWPRGFGRRRGGRGGRDLRAAGRPRDRDRRRLSAAPARNA